MQIPTIAVVILWIMGLWFGIGLISGLLLDWFNSEKPYYVHSLVDMGLGPFLLAILVHDLLFKGIATEKFNRLYWYLSFMALSARIRLLSIYYTLKVHLLVLKHPIIWLRLLDGMDTCLGGKWLRKRNLVGIADFTWALVNVLCFSFISRSNVRWFSFACAIICVSFGVIDVYMNGIGRKEETWPES